jgi:hypothetical protein
VALVAIPSTVAEMPPGFEVTVKLVAGWPDAVQLMVAARVLAVAETLVGMPGGAEGAVAALAGGAGRTSATSANRTHAVTNLRT